MSLRGCLRWLVLAAALLLLAACVGTRVNNLSSGSAPVPIDALLIVYRPTTFSSTSYNAAGSLGRRNLAELVPHLQGRLPALLQAQGIRARMVSELDLPNVRREADEKLMWIAAASAAYSTRSGQTLTMIADIIDPATRVSLWKGEIVMATPGFGKFDDSVVDSIGEQLVRQLRQARMMPTGGTPVAAPRAAPAAPAAAMPADIPTPRVFPVSRSAPLPPVADAPQAPSPPLAPPEAAPVPRMASGFAQLDDVDAIPYLSDRGRQVYRDWLALPTPRAFAIAPNGTFFSTSGLRPRDATLPPDPTERALLACERSAKVPCKLYAVNGAVVWVK